MITAPARDDHRTRVYVAEAALHVLLDNPHRSAQVAGTTVELEPETRFSGLRDAQLYLDRIVTHPEVIDRFGERGRVTVRERRSSLRAAHYDPQHATIAVNTGTRWGLRGAQLLHDLAHHYTPGAGHDAAFRHTLIDLIAIGIGPQAARALSLLYRTNGLTTERTPA